MKLILTSRRLCLAPSWIQFAQYNAWSFIQLIQCGIFLSFRFTRGYTEHTKHGGYLCIKSYDGFHYQGKKWARVHSVRKYKNPREKLRSDKISFQPPPAGNRSHTIPLERVYKLPNDSPRRLLICFTLERWGCGPSTCACPANPRISRDHLNTRGVHRESPIDLWWASSDFFCHIYRLEHSDHPLSKKDRVLLTK